MTSLLSPYLFLFGLLLAHVYLLGTGRVGDRANIVCLHLI